VYLLDTNVLSELRKHRRCHPSVARWIAGVRSEELHTSVLVLGEIRVGIESIRRRDPVAASRIEVWLRTIEEGYEDRILDVDRRVADVWARLNVPDRRPFIDAFLAATALVHDLVLVTRDVGDVRSTGVRHLDPWRDLGAGPA
jgi:predicted nucleic acid-binding protein